MDPVSLFSCCLEEVHLKPLFGSWSRLVTNIQKEELFNIWKSIFVGDKYPGGGANGDWLVVVSFAAGTTVLALPRPTAPLVFVYFWFLYFCVFFLCFCDIWRWHSSPPTQCLLFVHYLSVLGWAVPGSACTDFCTVLSVYLSVLIIVYLSVSSTIEAPTQSGNIHTGHLSCVLPSINQYSTFHLW